MLFFFFNVLNDEWKLKAVWFGFQVSMETPNFQPKWSKILLNPLKMQTPLKKKKCNDGFRKTAVPPQILYNAGSLQSCRTPCSLGKKEPNKYLIFIISDVWTLTKLTEFPCPLTLIPLDKNTANNYKNNTQICTL